nr:hypothetical protein [uncultured Romboutsia sp.]
MTKKIGTIIMNFLRILKLNELIYLFITPTILTIIIYFFSTIYIRDLGKFLGSFNSVVINVTAILAGFGMSSLGLLISSSSENIEVAKKTMTRRKDRNNKLVSYYKLQILRSFYSLLMLFGLLSYSLILIFLIKLSQITNILLFIEILLLIISIFSQVFVIQSLYFLFVEDK